MQQDLLSDDLFEKFRALIYRTAGIQIPGAKRVMLSNRLRRRLKATGIESYAEYYKRLVSGADRDELSRFLDAITTRETYFFRDPHHFRWLADRFVPELVERARLGRHPRSLAIWSAACSAGEEVYSILIRLAEAGLPPPDWKLSVLGTDISKEALNEARSASYRERSLRAVEEEERRRWFVRDAASECWTVRDPVRRLASFRQYNLIEPMTGGLFDCVYLKNVLIYFDTDSKRRAVRNVVNAIAPGGYLVIGPTEGIYSMLDPLERVESWLYRSPIEE